MPVTTPSGALVDEKTGQLIEAPPVRPDESTQLPQPTSQISQPPASPAVAPTPTDTTSPVVKTAAPTTTHTVQTGDTLSQIAQKYGVLPNQVTGFRSGNPNLIFPGEVLTVGKAPAVPIAEKPKPATPTAQVPETITPTASVAPTPTTFEDIFTKYGLSTDNNIEDVIKTLSKSFGFTEVNSQIEKLDNQYVDDVAEVNDDPWLTESVRVRKVAQLKDKYDSKKDALVNRLKLQQDIVGKAISVWEKEREFNKDMLFKSLDLREKELDRNKAFELSPGQARFEFNPITGQYEPVAGLEETGGTSSIKEYQFAVSQGFAGSFFDYQKAISEAKRQEGIGGLNPQQQAAAFKLADDFEQVSKSFFVTRDAYNRIVASSSDPSAAGDLSLIFNYMKLLDPGSVVREGEFATAQNSAGVPDRIRATYNNVISGERLAPNTRADFVDRANRLFTTALKQQQQTVGDYSNRAVRFGVPPEFVVRDIGSTETLPPPSSPPPTSPESQQTGGLLGSFLQGIFEAFQ